MKPADIQEVREVCATFRNKELSNFQSWMFNEINDRILNAAKKGGGIVTINCHNLCANYTNNIALDFIEIVIDDTIETYRDSGYCVTCSERNLITIDW